MLGARATNAQSSAIAIQSNKDWPRFEVTRRPGALSTRGFTKPSPSVVTARRKSLRGLLRNEFIFGVGEPIMCLGVPGKVIELMEYSRAKVDVSGNTVEISVKLTPEVEVGEYVLIHAGFAMEIIEESLALETMELLEELERYAGE
jgi:hydrogenase expression/formation protein HypC